MSAVKLTLGYGTNTVLTDVTTEFQPGRITALLGPTGSGKSTLLRTLNRMNDKISGYRRVGDVTLDGESIWSPAVHPMALRRRVGMLFQRPNPFPMSIMDNVVAGVRAHQRVSRSQLREMAEHRLRTVGLWDAVSTRLNDSPFHLTGPAEYRVSLESVSGLSAHVDPMGGDLTCVSFGASRQAASTDAASALRVAPGKQVGVLRLAWALNGTPAAISTTYLTGDMADPDTLARWLAERADHGGLPIPSPGPSTSPSPGPSTSPGPAHEPGASPAPAYEPHAVSVQMQLPSASAARRLRLTSGQMALVITMLFYDGSGGQPAALTTSVLRPDLFRVTLESTQAHLDGERLQAALALATTD